MCDDMAPASSVFQRMLRRAPAHHLARRPRLGRMYAGRGLTPAAFPFTVL